jgi:hypothetical protein
MRCRDRRSLIDFFLLRPQPPTPALHKPANSTAHQVKPRTAFSGRWRRVLGRLGWKYGDKMTVWPEKKAEGSRSEREDMKIHDDEWWWRKINDEWSCWCIMTCECITNDNEVILKKYVSVCPHGVFSNDCDDAREYIVKKLGDVHLCCKTQAEAQKQRIKRLFYGVATRRQSVAALAYLQAFFWRNSGETAIVLVTQKARWKKAAK